MTEMCTREGLGVDAALARFLEAEALPRAGMAAGDFWRGAARVFAQFAPRNVELLARREALQLQIDAWHEAHRDGFEANAYAAFLRAIGYLQPEPAPFSIETSGVDPEVATRAGPQLVVPALNARFLLNAANARWGSLYDALYGTDALPGAAAPGGYDTARGDEVVAWTKRFLDETFPLVSGGHAEVTRWSVDDAGALSPALADPDAFVGWRGPRERPEALLLVHHGLHMELRFDPASPVGARDPAGLADVVLESALTTIVDLEDSIAAVDAADKVAAYRNWLGVMTGELEAEFPKGGRILRRALEPDRTWTTHDGPERVLPGRSLMFVRNVGHLMTTPAVRLPDGGEAPEGVLDALVTALIGKVDVMGAGRFRNSAAGSVYIVKPKMHGPDEVAFADDLFDAVEDALGLSRHTLKIGVMDEERRTSANLAACIGAARGRLAFINTGFLDRTGDEIHTDMRAGPMVRKGAMKAQPWITAYEARNVSIGLACGLGGKAQIGKGMWAAPDRMADMLREKGAQLAAGASTAWTPSPTAATLHALHYHRTDVFALQAELAAAGRGPDVEALLALPLARGRNWSPEEVRAELENNCQGLLGYVVRWIDAGVGCSKVPDIHDVGLMEDRATLRISSQHLANWLLHAVCTREEVEAVLLRMAAVVDAQNVGVPDYAPMAATPDASLAFQAARALVFKGLTQPSGYTEPLLHAYRALKKTAPSGLTRDQA